MENVFEWQTFRSLGISSFFCLKLDNKPPIDKLKRFIGKNTTSFVVIQQRFDKIFYVPSGIHKIYLAGDNDIGGEGPDHLSSLTVGRFTKHFGPLNDIINIKSFQFVKVSKILVKCF